MSLKKKEEEEEEKEWKEEEEEKKKIRPIFYGDLKDNNQNALTPINIWNYLHIFLNNKLYTDQCPTSSTDTLPPAYVWDKYNYCNPPFNKTRQFIIKARQEQLKGKTTIMLCPANFHQIYMQKLFMNEKKKHKIHFVIINSKLTFDRIKKDGTQEHYKQPLSNLLCFIVFGKILERRIFFKKENENLKEVSKHYNYFKIFDFQKHSNYVSGFKYKYTYKCDDSIINNSNLSKQFLILVENTLNICKINTEKEEIQNNFKYFKEIEKKKEKNQKVQYNYQYDKKNRNNNSKKNGKSIPSYIKISTESFYAEGFSILGHYFNIKDFFENYLFANNPFEEVMEKNEQIKKGSVIQEFIIKVEKNKKYINYNLFLPYILESFLLKSNKYYKLNDTDIKLDDYINERSLQKNCYYNIYEFVEKYKDLLFSKCIFNLIIKKKFYSDISFSIDKIKQNQIQIQIYKGKIDLILLFDTLTRYYYHMMLKKNKGQQHMEFSCGLNLHFLGNTFKNFNTTKY